jgi:protocatechuate 3,4-dioxygenase beta subunit
VSDSFYVVASRVLQRRGSPAPFRPPYKISVKRSPQAVSLSFPISVSEITGSTFGNGLLGDHDADLFHNFKGESAIGPRIVVYGLVHDEFGRGTGGALVEVWQANAGGRYRHNKEGYVAAFDSNFGGCGRVISDADRKYEFQTIIQKPYPWTNGMNAWHPAHIHFSVFGHGFAQRLIAQFYFEGDPLFPI